MLLSLLLFSFTYNFITVSLNSSCILSRDFDSGELVLEDSILDISASRDVNLAELNLCQFAANYCVVHGNVAKYAAPVIVRTFPNLSSNPQSDNYAQYCNY